MTQSSSFHGNMNSTGSTNISFEIGESQNRLNTKTNKCFNFLKSYLMN